MRELTIIILLIILNNEFVSGQTNCGCDSKPDYNSFISCDTIKFDNDAMLYRQFNCDSSWLTFESKNLQKNILYSLSREMIDLTPRLGYQFVKEYSNALLFMNRQASGGGFPINYVLINKKNGEVSEELGPILFYSEDPKKEIIVTLVNDSIPLLSFQDVKSKEIKNYPISNDENDVTRFMSNEMFPENHFNNAILKENIFEIEYSYKESGNKNWLITIIRIEINDN